MKTFVTNSRPERYDKHTLHTIAGMSACPSSMDQYSFGKQLAKINNTDGKVNSIEYDLLAVSKRNLTDYSFGGTFNINEEIKLKK